MFQFFRFYGLLLLLNGIFMLTQQHNAIAQTILACDTLEKGNSNNLGIYGGLANDITYADNGRLFAACEVPASVFVSDDTAQTWYMAFPKDSLEFECGERGWGGGAKRIITNRKGWVGVHTKELIGNLSSAVISFNNGDSGSWYTAMDGYLLQNLGYTSTPVNGVAMSDFYFYAILKNYIVRIDTGITDSTDVIDIYSKITSLDSTFYIRSLAPTNSASGYPFYVVIDSSTSQSSKGNLYKYDGVSFSQLTLPTGISYVYQVFTHPDQISGDTLFINGINGSGKVKLYRSFDGGSSWANISPGTNSQADGIVSADYSPYWKSQMPSSNGLLLANGLAYISKNLGTSWIETATIPQSTANVRCAALAMHPKDTTLFAGNNMPGMYISTTGCKGPLVQQESIGLEAVLVWEIAHDDSESIFYIATQSGLAYTTKYKDIAIVGINKWKAPYGKFPIDSTDINKGTQSVAIDPVDSSHVIAGQAEGLFVTHTGPDGFYNVLPSGYSGGDNNTRDIAFVTSNIVIAVTGTLKDIYKGNGDIWRSADGGDSWTKVSSSSFGTGTTIAIGYGKTDTVIYVGSGLHNVENGYLWRSTDLGLSWTQINQGPTDVNNPLNQALVINEIVVDPRGKDTLYISAGYDTTMAFVKSYDGGITYQYITPLSTDWTNAIEIDPSNPDSTVYVSMHRRIYQYIPSLDSAELLYTSIPGDVIHDISIGSIIIGTSIGFYSLDNEKDTIATSIQSTLEKFDDVFLYPNPASTSFTICISASPYASMLHITILDMLGQNIQNISLKQQNEKLRYTIDCKNLSSGTYVVRIADKNKVVTKKLILSR